MRLLTGIVAALLIPLLTACDNPSPAAGPSLLAPSSPAPTAPSVRNGDKWDLTITLTSIAGPRECIGFGSPPPGGDPTVDSEPLLLTIERLGDSMHLVVSSIADPADLDEYTVTVAGADFSGSSTLNWSGYYTCGPSGRDNISHAEDRLVGYFSADGKTLTANEEAVFQLESGNAIAYLYAWAATRQ
jgi:hypothetical protein